ncbi:TraR/DksA C4-type zinc finger protein [Hydrotalea sp.]|uniref:TraR/DksA family transcriptional regulator n=1 Tax=Hydrotalea sp. TaxID=2881279 RepID=UPI002634CB00|nr:TraR/DksA C4-type zinc finger protein [Hydrotalea sp.]
MATKKTAPKKTAKPAARAVKKAAPAKKVAAAPKAAPVKKATVPAKKATPAAKAAPVRKTAVPAKKVAPVKKVAAPVKKAAAPAKKEVEATQKSKHENIHSEPVKPVKVVKSVTVSIMPKKKQPEPLKEVKVPKTSTKTSVPYRPGYTPLEKRVDMGKPTESIVRYSDSDLNEFRELINKKLDSAKRELAYLQGLITRKDELGGDESEGRYMTMEDGGMSMEREQLSQMASRQITYIDHLEKALMRIENKTYGICRVTGKLIDKARLRAVPHATLSLEAKLGLVKGPETGTE